MFSWIFYPHFLLNVYKSCFSWTRDKYDGDIYGSEARDFLFLSPLKSNTYKTYREIKWRRNISHLHPCLPIISCNMIMTFMPPFTLFMTGRRGKTQKQGGELEQNPTIVE
jgi:hypothetical protein